MKTTSKAADVDFTSIMQNYQKLLHVYKVGKN
jgi:hypothetical protein